MRLKIKWVNGWAHLHGTGPDGRRIRQSLKTQDARQAEEKRAQVEARLWRADLYGPEEVVTFDAAAVAYAEDGGEVRFLMRMAEQMQGIPLRDIRPKDVRDAARRAYPNASPATLNRQGITPAAAVINWAHGQGWCAPIRVRRFQHERPKRKAVDLEYIEALRPHLPHRLYGIMLFLHQTGRRVGDAIEMRPEWLDGTRVHIPRTKNGDPATVVLTQDLAAMLSELKPRHGRVFGYVHRSSVYSTLRRACAKAGVEYLGTHQPGRHSFATTLHKAGWGSKKIAEAGGWRSVSLVAQTYEHPENTAEEAAGVFDKKMASSPRKMPTKSANKGDSEQ